MTEFFFPPAEYVSQLKLKNFKTIRELCVEAQVLCRATGAWTERRVEIVKCDKSLRLICEPSTGNVRIYLKSGDKVTTARRALIILAYGIHDLVAKASVFGHGWSKPSPKNGRPRKLKPLTNKERQKKFREKLYGKKRV